MLQKKKPFAFKAEIHFTDLDMSSFGLVFFLSFGIKQERIVLQNSLSETQQNNLLLHPSHFNCQIVVSQSFRQQRCTAKLGSSVVPLHVSETLGKPSKSYEFLIPPGSIWCLKSGRTRRKTQRALRKC